MRFPLALVFAAFPSLVLAAGTTAPGPCPPGFVEVGFHQAPGRVTITEDIAARGTACVPAPPLRTPDPPPRPAFDARGSYREPDVSASELRLVSLNPPSPTALAQTTSTRVLTRTYDDFDRVSSETVPLEDGGSATIRYTYWRDGLRKTMTDALGRVTYYEYDGKARLERVTANQGLPDQHITSYAYWPDDLLKTIAAPNGLLTSYDYDLADRVKSIVVSRDSVPLLSYAYTYDRNGNRLTQTETNGGAAELTTYTYDARDRLTTVTYPTGVSVAYGYDEVGNRTSEIERNAAGDVVSNKTAVFDALNRLSVVRDAETQASIASFTHDANGNLTSKTTASGTETYDYDPRDLMVESRSGAAITARFAYDAFGRRHLKVGTDGVTSGAIRQYLYDQTSVLHELDSDDLEVAKYEYGGDRLLALTRRDEPRRFYHHDALGSVVALSDNAGAVVARYHLDAWGRYRSPDELTHSKNRFGFTGYLFDQETDLYYAKARFYDPEYGRFTSQDSVLGEINEPPSLHRYFYGYANPLRYVDPTGHSPDEIADRAHELGNVDDRIVGADQLGRVLKDPLRTVVPQREVPSAEQVDLGIFEPQDRKRLIEGSAEAAARYSRSPIPVQIQETDSDVQGCGGDATCLSVVWARRDQLHAAETFGQVGGTVGREVVSLSSGTGGDIYTAATGVDPGTEDRVGLAGRGMAVAGVLIPGLSGAELRAAANGVSELRLAQRLRRTRGVATGGTKLAEGAGGWLRGTHGNAGLVPKEVADRMRGKEFRDFDHFREEFWLAVSQEPRLTEQFSPQNVGRIQKGWAPRVVQGQQLGDQTSYILHHRTPIGQGGGVYDLDNIAIVTPRFHKDVLDPALHYGK
jgi:RHS repeat-associated protein